MVRPRRHDTRAAGHIPPGSPLNNVASGTGHVLATHRDFLFRWGWMITSGSRADLLLVKRSFLAVLSHRSRDHDWLVRNPLPGENRQRIFVNPRDARMPVRS